MFWNIWLETESTDVTDAPSMSMTAESWDGERATPGSAGKVLEDNVSVVADEGVAAGGVEGTADDEEVPDMELTKGTCDAVSDDDSDVITDTAVLGQNKDGVSAPEAVAAINEISSGTLCVTDNEHDDEVVTGNVGDEGAVVVNGFGLLLELWMSMGEAGGESGRMWTDRCLAIKLPDFDSVYCNYKEIMV